MILSTGLGGGARSRTPGSEDGELPSWTADTACSTAWALWWRAKRLQWTRLIYKRPLGGRDRSGWKVRARASLRCVLRRRKGTKIVVAGDNLFAAAAAAAGVRDWDVNRRQLESWEVAKCQEGDVLKCTRWEIFFFFYLVQSRVRFQLLVVGVLDVHSCVSDLDEVAEER